MKLARVTAAVTVLSAAPALAANLRVEMEIPRLPATEYHFPYVAIWIERADQTPVTTLTVWYDRNLHGEEGQRYLAELRTWWRVIGHGTELPIDGVTGPTRAPGLNGVALLGSNPLLRDVSHGEYCVVIEAVREEGAHELVRVPIQWDGQPHEYKTKGDAEIGEITISIYR
jgi:hypothetical protein